MSCKIIRCLTVPVIILALAMSFIACKNNELPTSPTANETSKAGSKPEVVSVSIGPGPFRSNKYHLEVQLPPGWVAVEGPEPLVSTGHLEGQIAFNSWGQKDFWVREVRRGPEDYALTTFGDPRDVMAQIPEGGAYISLLRFSGPPPPPDSVTDDLSNLWQPHDWRRDSATEAQSKELFKWGQWLEMWVDCRPEATDETVAQLNDLLQSWRFDVLPTAPLTPEPYFPVQKEFQTTVLTSLIQGKLVLNNGYLRVYDELIIWPYGYSLKTEGKEMWVINEKGQPAARVGDEVGIGGGEIPADFAEEKIGHPLPEGCEGPYWLAGGFY